MALWNTVVGKVIGTKNERELKRLQPLVVRINELEPALQKLSDADLKAKTGEFRERLARGATVDDILPEAFATVREAARRVLNMRHFDVQLVGGAVLHAGKIAEMATGEGKTLVATLPAYLNALAGRGVHIVTVNDYLAKRDSQWMGGVYQFLGLSVGLIQHDMLDTDRGRAYAADITYGTNNEFGFDYLRDNMKFSLEEMVQRELHYAIVDEVDSILIDEARTPLIISGPADESTDLYYQVDRIIPRLKRAATITEGKLAEIEAVQEGDFIVDEKAKTVAITEQGVAKVEHILGIANLYDPSNIDTLHHVQQALRAHNLFQRDVDYMVKDGQVLIVDEFTGRLMPGRRWSDGLHQAVEAKEKVKIERENQTLATITFQNYFRMYDKLAGMTGTADTEAAEFAQIYDLDVNIIPTNRQLVRTSYPDVIYRTEREKLGAVVEEIAELYEEGRPVLVGTTSIEKSEKLSTLLKRRGVPHQVLNAKYHEREAEIVAQAGRYKSVTIATNMAGRGTDILLGGHPHSLVREMIRREEIPEDVDAEEMVKAFEEATRMQQYGLLDPAIDPEAYARCLTEVRSLCNAEHERVVELGFVQISDENLHYMREVMDETFGAENMVSVIAFKKTGYQASGVLPSNYDYICWYARDKTLVKFRQLHVPKMETSAFVGQDLWLELPDGERRRMTREEAHGDVKLPDGARIFRHKLAEGAGAAGNTEAFEFEGKTFRPKEGKHWSTTPDGMKRLAEKRRFIVIGNSLRFVNYLDDFPVTPITSVWPDTVVSGFADPQMYVVQTNTKVVQRCVLMTTDPGDLVLDPTCGSGTTAYVAEQWGRRWITIDCSRVPLALARQRLLTATFPWYELQNESRGPGSGFVYKRKQNRMGEEVGGIVPHIKLEDIANNEPPKEEILVDRPEVNRSITRVTGPFTVEATIPTPMGWQRETEDLATAAVGAETDASFVDRMLEILRRSPVLRLEGNRTVTLKNVRLPAKTLSLSAEALVMNGGDEPVAFVFGPENGAVSERLVYEAAREAYAKNYSHLYVVGFAIQPNARMLIEKCAEVVGVRATYVQATPDLMMGDLLKNMRSSQIFSVCGLPEIAVRRAKSKTKNGGQLYEAELLGLDLFDPATMQVEHRDGKDVPAWFLDTDYNGLCFHVSQAFFPRTGAWERLRKALKGEYEESVWEHLAGTVSAPFEPGEHKQIAVKVIDDRGNELLVVEPLK